MRRVLVGTTVAIIGIVGILGSGYSAGAQPRSPHDARKLAKALKDCKKDKSSSKRKKCEKTAEARYKSKTTTGGHGSTGTGTGTAAGTSTGTGTGTAAGTSGRRRGHSTGTGAGTPTGTATGAGTAGAGTAGTTTGPPTTGPEPAPMLIPSGVVAISVKASACSPPGTPACGGREEAWAPPHGMYVSQIITEPGAVAEMIATIESLPLVPNASEYECPRDLVGEPEVELQFRESLQGEAVVRAVGSVGGCNFLYFINQGKPAQAGRRGVRPVISVIEKLLGVEL